MLKNCSYIVTAVVLASALSTAAVAQDFTNQWEIKSGTSELVFPGMQPQDVAGKVKSALSQWAIPANLSYRSMPSETPERPDEPTKRQVYIQGAPAIEYHCPTAYAEITKRPPPIRNSFAFIAEITQACFYNFQNGVKVYLVMTRAKRTESLTAGLFNGITGAIQGTDGERITKELKENIDSIRKEIPSVLVERMEVPEMPVQEPDKAAVAKIIPAKKQVSQQVQAAPIAVPTAPAKLTSAQQKIEARKNLTGMGMSYHSQEQFIASILRTDDVAVSLFLDGGGVNLEAKDASGKTALAVAKETGNEEIIKLIEERLSQKATSEKPKVAVPRFTPEQLAQFREKADCSNRLKEFPTSDPESYPHIKSELDKLPPDVRAKKAAELKASVESTMDFVNQVCPPNNEK